MSFLATSFILQSSELADGRLYDSLSDAKYFCSLKDQLCIGSKVFHARQIRNFWLLQGLQKPPFPITLLGSPYVIYWAAVRICPVACKTQ